MSSLLMLVFYSLCFGVDARSSLADQWNQYSSNKNGPYNKNGTYNDNGVRITMLAGILHVDRQAMIYSVILTPGGTELPPE